MVFDGHSEMLAWQLSSRQLPTISAQKKLRSLPHRGAVQIVVTKHIKEKFIQRKKCGWKDISSRDKCSIWSIMKQHLPALCAWIQIWKSSIGLEYVLFARNHKKYT